MSSPTTVYNGFRFLGGEQVKLGKMLDELMQDRGQQVRIDRHTVDSEVFDRSSEVLVGAEAAL